MKLREIIKILNAKVIVNNIDNERDIEMACGSESDWVRELGFGAGMGLPNIKKCSDEMKLESEVGVGTNLQFIIYTRDEVKKYN